MLAVVAIAVSAQRGRVITLDALDVEGAETVSSEVFKTTGSYNSVSVQALCTEIGGTTDGTISLWASNDGTNWVFLNGSDGSFLTASPKASIAAADSNKITMTSGLVANWVVDGSPFREWKVTGVGTISDTTQVDIIVVLK